MKKFLKDIAQGIYDGLQENETTHNQYSFQEIYDVIQEFVSYLFFGMILSVGAIFAYPYYKAFISLGAVLLLVWAFILYYFLNSTDFKKIKKKWGRVMVRQFGAVDLVGWNS